MKGRDLDVKLEESTNIFLHFFSDESWKYHKGENRKIRSLSTEEENVIEVYTYNSA